MKTSQFTNTVILLFFVFSFSVLDAQNLIVSNGVATFHGDTIIGQKFLVPDSWNKIIIKEDVTIRGSFYMPTRNKAIEIMGESRKTSIIRGIKSMHDLKSKEGRQYSGIRCDKSPDVYIHHLKSYNPDKFHISAGNGNVKVESCDLIDDRGQHTTDGVHGGMNKTEVIDCYINTWDDALYISECKLVKNCTIVNNHNGAPFQVGWGKDIGTNSCKIENCVVIDAHKGPQSRYYMGVVGWAGRKGSGPNTMNIEFVNFKRERVSGAMKAPMFQFGLGNTGISNCTINITGYCVEESDVAYYVSENCTLIQGTCQTLVSEKIISSNSKSIEVFPNPVAENFNVQLNGFTNAQVKIIDLSGKLIYQINDVNETLFLNTEQFNKGIYLIEASDKNNSIVKKLMVN